MPTFTSFNSLGTSIEGGEITDGAVSYVKLSTDLEKWELIEELIAAGDGSVITTGTLPVAENYKVEIENASGSTALDLLMQLNGDTSTNYGGLSIDNVTPTAYGSASGIKICSTNLNVFVNAKVRVEGKTFPTASGRLHATIDGGGQGGSGVESGIGGRWTGGNDTQVTSIKILTSTGTFSGRVRVFKRVQT